MERAEPVTVDRPGATIYQETRVDGYRRITGEFWTAQQRQMHSLHYAVSYRASFKPELRLG